MPQKDMRATPGRAHCAAQPQLATQTDLMQRHAGAVFQACRPSLSTCLKLQRNNMEDAGAAALASQLSQLEALELLDLTRSPWQSLRDRLGFRA